MAETVTPPDDPLKAWSALSGTAEKTMRDAEEAMKKFASPEIAAALPTEKRAELAAYLEMLKAATSKLGLSVAAATESAAALSQQPPPQARPSLTHGDIPWWIHTLRTGSTAPLDFIRDKRMQEGEPSDHPIFPGISTADLEVCETIERELIDTRYVSSILEFGTGHGWRAAALSRRIRMATLEGFDVQKTVAETLAWALYSEKRAYHISVSIQQVGPSEILEFPADIFDCMWFSRGVILSWSNLSANKVAMALAESVRRSPWVIFRWSPTDPTTNLFRQMANLAQSEVQDVPLSRQAFQPAFLSILRRHTMLGSKPRRIQDSIVSDVGASAFERCFTEATEYRNEVMFAGANRWWFCGNDVAKVSLPRNGVSQETLRTELETEAHHWRELGGSLPSLPKLADCCADSERTLWLTFDELLEPLRPPFPPEKNRSILAQTARFCLDLLDRGFHWNDVRLEHLGWLPNSSRIGVLSLARIAGTETEETPLAFVQLALDLQLKTPKTHGRPLRFPRLGSPENLSPLSREIAEIAFKAHGTKPFLEKIADWSMLEATD